MAKTKSSVNVDDQVVDVNKIMGVNPHIIKRSMSERESPTTFNRSAVSLGKMLHSFQVDGVSLNNTTLLSRQYDDEYGLVDPASDIHTDPHLLMDALMRRGQTTGQGASKTTKEEPSSETAE